MAQISQKVMGYIKEPKGVYLVIPPSKLSQKEAAEISDFIQKDKLKNKNANYQLIAPRIAPIAV